MQRQRYTCDTDGDNTTTAFPGFVIVVGLLLFSLIVGMIGWSTYPPPLVYPHSYKRYELDDEDDEWEEHY
jgi:hypothetical protein